MNYTFLEDNEDESILLVVGDEDDSNLPLSSKWTDEEILLLIETYKKHEPKFKSPQYSHAIVWRNISLEVSEKGTIRDAKKCSEKWRNLKKTYEKIKRHHSQTGNDKRHWKFFDLMHDVFYKNPSIYPIATASSSGLSTVRSPSTSDVTSPTSRENNAELPSAEGNETPKRTIRKRKREDSSYFDTMEERKEKRHLERMEQKERMFKLFMAKMFPNNAEHSNSD